MGETEGSCQALGDEIGGENAVSWRAVSLTHVEYPEGRCAIDFEPNLLLKKFEVPSATNMTELNRFMDYKLTRFAFGYN